MLDGLGGVPIASPGSSSLSSQARYETKAVAGVGHAWADAYPANAHQFDSRLHIANVDIRRPLRLRPLIESLRERAAKEPRLHPRCFRTEGSPYKSTDCGLLTRVLRTYERRAPWLRT